MQPILVISRNRALANTRGLLPDTDAPVIVEANWLEALRLCGQTDMAMVVIDLSLPHHDVFEIGRLFWRQTLTPILFVDSRTLVETETPVAAAVQAFDADSTTGWMTWASDDIAVSKRADPAQGLIERAQRRIG